MKNELKEWLVVEDVIKKISVPEKPKVNVKDW